MDNNGYINENKPADFFSESVALEAIVDYLPDIDKALLKNTAIQYARTRNRKFSRELFRILKAAFEKIQYSQKQDKDNGI